MLNVQILSHFEVGNSKLSQKYAITLYNTALYIYIYIYISHVIEGETWFNWFEG